MMKIFAAFMCCAVFSSAPLWAADTHVFEFDYDNQIEAPVLNVPPEATTPTAIPMETQKELVIPPPPVEVKMAAPEPLAAEKKEAAEEATLDLLFMPVEAADSAPKKEPEKLAPPAAPAPAPKVAVPTSRPDIVAAIEKAAPKAQIKKEKIQARKQEAKRPRKAPAKAAAKTAAPTARASAPPMDDSFYRRDPRYRFWLIATRTWNLSVRALPAVAPQPQVLDLKKFSGFAGDQAKVTDLKNFPKIQ